MNWLKAFWSSSVAVAEPAEPVSVRPAPEGEGHRARTHGGRTHQELDAGEAAFLMGLVFAPAPRAADEVSRDDRLFIDGVEARVGTGQVDVPVLPQVAIRLSELLRKGDAPVSEYVGLLNEDPALSAEVLRSANSAFYGAARTTSSLQEAIVRIGLTRVQSILMMGSLRARILKVGPWQRKAELLLDMALPVATLASRLSPDTAAADTRFMRGLLMHVEHLVIIGLIAEIAREHRAMIAPSIEAMYEAFDRFGPSIRGAVAASWELTELLTGGDEASEVGAEYAGLRYALICRWLGQPLPPLPGIDADRLASLMAPITPRQRTIAIP
jgi:HD-like signal output (HDOD) protein